MSDNAAADTSVNSPQQTAPDQGNAAQSASQPVKTAPQEDSSNPPWLPERLKKAREQERKTLLESIGVDSHETLKQRLERLNELETAQLSEKERTEKEIETLRGQVSSAEKVTKLNAELTEFMFGQIPDKAREAIEEAAGDDPAARWSAMKMLAKAGSLQLPQLGAVAPQAAPKPPASTAPAGTPAPPKPGQTESLHDQWQRLKQSDPSSAAIFYRFNAQAIEQSKGT